MPNSNENQVDKSALMNSSANGLAAKVLNTLPKNQNPAVKNSNLLLHKSVSIRIFSRNMAYLNPVNQNSSVIIAASYSHCL